MEAKNGLRSLKVSCSNVPLTPAHRCTLPLKP